MLRTSIINFVSKIGLSIPLLYTIFESFFNPDEVVSRWPNFFSHHVNQNALVLITGISAIALLVWMFSNRYKFNAVITIFCGFVLTLLINITDLRLLFNSIPALCLALGLSLRYYPRVRVIAPTKVTVSKEHLDLHNEIRQPPTNPDNDHDQHLFVPDHK